MRGKQNLEGIGSEPDSSGGQQEGQRGRGHRERRHRAGSRWRQRGLQGCRHMGIFVLRVQILYRFLKVLPACWVSQDFPCRSPSVPGLLVGIVNCVLDDLRASCPLTALAKVLNFREVAGKVVGITTEPGRILAGA
jgi:hypothetical protein